MLNWHIYIAHYLFIAEHCVHQFFRNRVRISIQHPQPLYAIYFGKLIQQFCQLRFAVYIGTVCGSVLRYQRKLLNSACRKRLRFLNKLFYRHAAPAAANQRYCAICAAVVAPVRNAEIGAVFRRG